MPSYDPREANPVLASYLESQVPAALRPEQAIHEDDFMFRFCLGEHRGHREGALVAYFHSGWTLAQTVGQLLDWARPGWREGRILDFAAGFGRGTRYLVRMAAGASRVWVSDIFPAMMAFQEETFGVQGFLSTARPEDLEPPGPFDVIVVSSLFSHLPAETFERWLSRLGVALAEGGVLLFSVHGEEVRPAGATMPGSGLLFEPYSEMPEVGADQYGSTWVSEAYVERTIAEALPAGATYRRAPRALWAYQDVYIAGGALPGGDPPVVGHPVGFADLPTELAGPDRLELSGWAADLAGRPVTIGLSVEGEEVARTGTGIPRPGVVEFLRDPRFPDAGFHLVAERPGRPYDPRERVLVEATVPGGTTHVLACDTLQGLLGEGRLQALGRAAEAARRGRTASWPAWPRRLVRRLRAWRSSGPSVE